MPDLLWDDVKEWFDPGESRSLPDVHVLDTTTADWQAVVDLVRSKGWAYEYSVDGRVVRLPYQVEDMFGRRDKSSVMLKVWPARDVLAIFRPYVVERIDFDVDLRELQGQERLDMLCQFLRAIGRRLGRPVVLTPEGYDTRPLFGYDVEVGRVVVLDGAGSSGGGEILG